ncbi:MAG: pyruvate,orthophosphate dikinase [Saprospiraceae bacterium]
MKKYIYTFGDGKAEGNAGMKNLLGGKGANLAEMNLIEIPVPPGFTVTTEACTLFNSLGKEVCFIAIKTEVEAGVRHLEQIMGTSFGDRNNPLLLSVRSGARASMPGMMDTVLNLGLNDEVVEGISIKTGDPRFAWDSYRRLIQMYGEVVLGLKPEKNEEDPFENLIKLLKIQKGIKEDNELKVEDLRELVSSYKSLIKERTGKEFPADPWTQLWGAVFAVFESWNNSRAELYRKLNGIPAEWGTAVNVQAMVYGNLGNTSATGVAFTRNAATGEDLFNGEFLINAQGEDVVAGIRTPQEVSLEGSRRWAKMTKVSEEVRNQNYPSLEEVMPVAYKKLIAYETRLENHYKDMQDIEFTIQEDKLWILQTRNGKRTGAAMVRIAMDMLKQGMIDEKTALMRIDPVRIDDLLHPIFETKAINNVHVIAQGLPASPGAATGQIVFFADDVEDWVSRGKKTILVRKETSPEDLRGMHLAKGILTTRGGMTSHAAIVARGMGKCCISGAGELVVDYKTKTIAFNGSIFNEGDWISLNGTTGEVYEGEIATKDPDLTNDLKQLLEIADKHAKLEVRANADTPVDAQMARDFGARGIGLARTEHMFFEADQIIAMRKMILADDLTGRRKALANILPIQRADFEGLFENMHDFPVTIRLLDPPLHEFLPHEPENQQEMADTMNVSLKEIQDKVASLAETNPMLGHRGCRLGITYPEITEIQTQAIIEAALNVKKRGIHVFPEIMIPLIGRSREFMQQEKIIRKTAEKVFEQYGDRIPYHVGTMIEVPRAALTADLIAAQAEFFSFGTNDLTQLTFGFSRDDIGKFLPMYLKEKIIDADPFEQIDENGVGRLVKFAAEKGRKVRPNMPLGACGEHGGNPESIDFFHRVGLNYVSCSPYRVPIARMAAAQANIRNS